MKSFSSQGMALFLSVLSLSSFATARSIRRDAGVPVPYGNLTTPYNATNASSIVNATSATPPPMNTPTLLPAVHWEHPMGDIENLAPINSTDLYYSHNGVSDPAVKHLFAQVSASLHYQAVVLEHSAFVQNVSCSADGILVNFASPQAFQYAASSWPNVDDFVLVTYTDGCGASQDQRTFWLIDDLNFRNTTNSIVAVVKQEIAVEDALNEVNLIWGTYHPPGSNSTNATSTVTSAAKRSFDHADPSITKSADINLFPPADSSAPWPNAFKVFSDSGSKGNASATLDIYCVDCGLKGHVTVAGSADFRIFPPKLESLNANINANLQAGLKVGLDATASFSDTKSKSLLNQAIPDLGFTVAKVFSAGVFVTVDATATIEVDAEAQILAGVTASLPSFAAELNLIDDDSAKSSKVTGYQPQWDKTFSAKGTVNAKATVALPIGLNLGIEITPISWKKSVALIEQPSIVGQVTVAGSVGNGGPASDTCNDGLEYSVNAVNDISLNLFDIKTFTLEHYESPDLIHGCLQLPGAKTSTTTSVAATTRATSASGKPTGSSNHTTAIGTGVSGRPTGYANSTGHAGTGVSGRPTGTGFTGRPTGTGFSGKPPGYANHTAPAGTGRPTSHGGHAAPTGSGAGSYGSGPTISGTGSPASRTHTTFSTKTANSTSTGSGAYSTRPAATTGASSSSAGLPSYGSTTTQGEAKTTSTSAGLPSYGSTTTQGEAKTTSTSSHAESTSTCTESTTTKAPTTTSESTTAKPTTTSKAESTTTTTTTTTTTSSTSTKAEATTSAAKTSKASKPSQSGSYGSESY